MCSAIQSFVDVTKQLASIIIFANPNKFAKLNQQIMSLDKPFFNTLEIWAFITVVLDDFANFAGENQAFGDQVTIIACVKGNSHCLEICGKVSLEARVSFDNILGRSEVKVEAEDGRDKERKRDNLHYKLLE